jgi:hypothetical protein
MPNVKTQAKNIVMSPARPETWTDYAAEYQQKIIIQAAIFFIRGSHGGMYEEYTILCCNALHSEEYQLFGGTWHLFSGSSKNSAEACSMAEHATCLRLFFAWRALQL